MTTDQEKKFRLYPHKSDVEAGIVHNNDIFFHYHSPERLKSEIQNGWKLEGSTREFRGRKFEFVTCLHHDDCFTLSSLEDGALFLSTGICDTNLAQETEARLIELINQFPEQEKNKLRHAAKSNALKKWQDEIISYIGSDGTASSELIKRKLKAAEPSSQYIHPFKGFDRVDEDAKAIGWTVEGLIPNKALVSFHGERESLKSFCALHLALSVATGSEYFGNKTRQGPVLYLAPEGSTGLGIRRDAWLKEHDWFGCYVPFYKRGGSFSFTNEDDKHWLATQLNNVRDFEPRLVIFDTLGQSLGEADENSASDINRIARYLNDLKIAHDCCFLWIDHSGHDGNRARGSSAKGAALDVEFHIKRKGNQITLRNTKMKDAPRAKTIHLEAKAKYDSLILEQVAPEPTHADVLLAKIGKADDMREAVIRQSCYSVCSAKTQAAKQKAFQRAL